jgi:hypothetical protein
MNGCLLSDAFQSPGCDDSYAAKEARREERRKAKRCKGPAMAFLDVNSGGQDPDRQRVRRVPEVPAMNPVTGLRQHEPVDAPQGYEPFADAGSAARECQDDVECQKLRELLPRSDNDPVGDSVRSVLPLAAAAAAAKGPGGGGGAKKNYFGADPDEPFANYTPDVDNFLMEPTQQQGFGIGAFGASAALPPASSNNYWKPVAPSGVDTAFFKSSAIATAAAPAKVPVWEEGNINRKIDQIMARLDDLQRTRVAKPEQAQTEILLFVSSGVLVLFLMDLLVKKGGRLF